MLSLRRLFGASGDSLIVEKLQFIDIFFEDFLAFANNMVKAIVP